MSECLQQVRETHRPTYRRKRLGCHPINGRTLWGCEVACACGWTLKWNESKRETERAWREHTREIAFGNVGAKP